MNMKFEVMIDLEEELHKRPKEANQFIKDNIFCLAMRNEGKSIQISCIAIDDQLIFDQSLRSMIMDARDVGDTDNKIADELEMLAAELRGSK